MIKWALAAFVGCAPVALGQLGGSGELTPTPLGGGQYSDVISIHNSGTTTIGTFWFAWIRGGDFLFTAPTSVASPAGWTGFVQGGPGAYSIEWVANSAASYLASGGSLSGFSFQSGDSPSVLTGPASSDPSYLTTTSFFYVGPALGDPGFQLVVSVVPAPGGLGVCGVAGALLIRRRRVPHQ